MRFLCVVGTRPEAIKLAPVILCLARYSQVTTICSGQHTALAEEPLAWFGIEPDDRIAIDSEFAHASRSHRRHVCSAREDDRQA